MKRFYTSSKNQHAESAYIYIENDLKKKKKKKSTKFKNKKLRGGSVLRTELHKTTGLQPALYQCDKSTLILL